MDCGGRCVAPMRLRARTVTSLFALGLLAECNFLLEIMGFCDTELNQYPDDPVYPYAMLVGGRQDRIILFSRDIEPMHDTSTKTQLQPHTSVAWAPFEPNLS